MKVFAAVYSHEYGEDVRVFSSEEKAKAWKDEIGKSWWEDEFPDRDMPEDNIGDTYFDLQHAYGDEWFTISECEVE